jgi:deoxyadenosine/deoxycytidine kinase
MFIAVAGNIGSGKTTLTNKLSERLACRPMFESVDDNPYLEDFYKDMNRYSFPLQVYFLNHRFSAHRAIDINNFSAIQDRSIYEDAHIFAKNLFRQGKMSERDFENYFNLYSTVVSYLNPPTLMIFLKRSVPKLMERIAQRGRECEKSISVDYIAQLNDLYAEWYASYNLGKYLLVDTDDLDFLHNEDHFERLVSKIHNAIAQKDMFLTLN